MPYTEIKNFINLKLKSTLKISVIAKMLKDKKDLRSQTDPRFFE